MDIDLKSTHYTEDLPLAPLTIKPLTLTPVTVTPIAVHLKELNQIAPLSVESLRVDHVRHVDPLRIEFDADFAINAALAPYLADAGHGQQFAR